MVQRGFQFFLVQSFVAKIRFTFLGQRFSQLDLFDPFDEIFVLFFRFLFVVFPFDLSVQLSSEILLSNVRWRRLTAFSKDIGSLNERTN